MSDLKKIGLLFSLVSCLAACSSRYDNSGEQRYLASKNGATLVVPSPLTTTNLGYFYNLPPQNQDARISIKPPSV